MANCTADSITECSRCESRNLIRQTGDDEPSIHYGRLKCGDCDKHIQWLKDPGLTLEVEARNKALDEILQYHNHKLNHWERTFIKEMLKKRYLTDKQKHTINNIGAKTIGKRICALDPNKNPPVVTGRRGL